MGDAMPAHKNSSIPELPEVFVEVRSRGFVCPRETASHVITEVARLLSNDVSWGDTECPYADGTADCLTDCPMLHG